jgi:hypothetical protein
MGAKHSVESTKRVLNGVTSPLDDAGILLHVLSILGPGQHLFISAVSKAWRESYKQVASVQVASMIYNYNDPAMPCLVTAEVTLYSAGFASSAVVRLAHEHGIAFDNNENLQRIAGRVADVPTLQVAHKLGLPLTKDVLIGAAECGSTLKLEWLHTEQGCELHHCLCRYAARGGSNDTLRWLKEHGSLYGTCTCEGAAAGAHQHVLQYLRDAGCEWDEDSCSAAAESGHIAILQWLHEQGCPWQPDEICSYAAVSGSMDMLRYLRQERCAFNEQTIFSAALRGHHAVCLYLLAEQCPYDAQVHQLDKYIFI